MPKKQQPTMTQLGLLHIMNSPVNPTTKEGLEAFREMKKAAGMQTKEMLDYIGRKSHFPRQVEADKKKQDSRLENLQPSE